MVLVLHYRVQANSRLQEELHKQSQVQVKHLLNQLRLTAQVVQLLCRMILQQAQQEQQR